MRLARRGFFGLLSGGVVAVVAKTLGIKPTPQPTTVLNKATITPAMHKAMVGSMKGMFNKDVMEQAAQLMLRKDAFTLATIDLPHPDLYEGLRQRAERAYESWMREEEEANYAQADVHRAEYLYLVDRMRDQLMQEWNDAHAVLEREERHERLVYYDHEGLHYSA